MFEVQKDGDQFVFPLYEFDVVPDFCWVNSVPMRCIEIRHAEADQAARWNLISKELEFAEAQIGELIKRSKAGPAQMDRRDTEGMIRKALFDSAIISYSKCFAEGVGRRVKLESKDVFTGAEGEALLDHHKDLTNLRNQYLAHAGVNRYEGAKTFAVKDPNPPRGASPNCVVAHSWFMLPQARYVVQTLKVVEFVKGIVAEKVRLKLHNIARKAEIHPQKYGVEEVFKPRTR
jgi:hypothetical protein